VLHDDERELGVALIDIGGGTTDITIFSEGSIVHSSVITAGGNHVTNDVAVGLRTPSAEAERIKQQYGCALTAMIDPDEEVEVPSVGGRAPRRISRRVLCSIIEPRVEEMFMLVRREIASTGFEDLLASGAVITGGCSNLEGLAELAEGVLGLPVRRGAPHNIGGLVDVVRNPMFATGVGLVQHAAKQQTSHMYKGRVDRVGLTSRVKEWLARMF
jgi:cell division protein FtsA